MITGKKLKRELSLTVAALDDKTKYLTVEEFAEKHGYSPSSIRQMLRRDQIGGAVRVGKRWMIDEDAGIFVRQYTKKSCDIF